MRSTIMDNAKSDLIITRMAIEYYDNLREKDIKRHACYHLSCCVKKIFIAILVNDDIDDYDTLKNKTLKEIYVILKTKSRYKNNEIIENVHTLMEWDERNTLFSIDFRPNIELIKTIYSDVTSFFDNIYDKNTVN